MLIPHASFPVSMHAEAAPYIVHEPEAPPGRPRGVPLTGASDVKLQLPVRLQVRLAAESLLTGLAADELAACAIEMFLDARQAGRESN